MILRRLLVAGILLGGLGCTRVREVFQPANFITEKRPPVVFVMKRSRAVVTVENPRISGDSVLGTVPGANSPLAVPFSDVHSVSAVRVDGVRTTILALGATGAAALMLYAFSGSWGAPIVHCDYMTEVRWGCPDR